MSHKTTSGCKVVSFSSNCFAHDLPSSLWMIWLNRRLWNPTGKLSHLTPAIMQGFYFCPVLLRRFKYLWNQVLVGFLRNAAAGQLTGKRQMMLPILSSKLLLRAFANEPDWPLELVQVRIDQSVELLFLYTVLHDSSSGREQVVVVVP